MYEDQKDKKIRDLEQELYIARSHVIGMVPDAFHELLHGYGFTDSGVLADWERDAGTNIANAAVADPAMSNGHEDRGPCPLCRSRGAGWGDADGYKLPGGLLRHLHGEGTARRCPVMEAAIRILRDRHKATFDKAYGEEREALANRKKTEPVLRFNPNREPEFLTETGTRGARNADQLAAAEQTLTSLGFVTEKTDNITAYKLACGDSHMLFADPRVFGKIVFRLFKRSGKKSWKSQPKYNNSFYLKDDWKDLPGKFHQRLQALLDS